MPLLQPEPFDPPTLKTLIQTRSKSGNRLQRYGRLKFARPPGRRSGRAAAMQDSRLQLIERWSWLATSNL